MSETTRRVPSLNRAGRCYAVVSEALMQAVSAGGDPLRFFTLATVAMDGSPEARTMVLRGFDAENRMVEFHTDARSPKVRELRADPRVTLLFHDHLARWQLRIRATAEVHHRNAIAREVWLKNPATSRGNYASPFVSGDLIPADAVWVPPANIPDEAPEVFANFVVVRCLIETADVYVLGAQNHERGILTWDEGQIKLTRVGT